MAEVLILNEVRNSKLMNFDGSPHSKLETTLSNDPVESDLKELEFVLEYFDKIEKVSEETVIEYNKEYAKRFPSLSTIGFSEEEMEEFKLKKDQLFAEFFNVDINKEFAMVTDWVNGKQLTFVATQN